MLIGIRRIGICGTDYHIFEGLHPFLQYPRVMGHELSAEVLEAPKGSAFAEGDPVVVIPYLFAAPASPAAAARPIAARRCNASASIATAA